MYGVYFVSTFGIEKKLIGSYGNLEEAKFMLGMCMSLVNDAGATILKSEEFGFTYKHKGQLFFDYIEGEGSVYNPLDYVYSTKGD